MKKKYRVTPRGKVVFSLTGLLLIYGIYMLLTPPPEPMQPESTHIEVTTPIEEADQTTSIEDATSEEVIPEEDVPVLVTENSGETESGETVKVENCTTNKSEMEDNTLRLLDAAGFTVYYEPNAYYVPESDLPLIAEFVAVAKEFTDEQIVIEGNVNKSVGPENTWDTEDVNELGYTRALVIKNDLIKHGIEKERIIIYNNKDEKTLNVDLSDKSIALNRRVDVFFSQFMYNEIDTK